MRDKADDLVARLRDVGIGHQEWRVADKNTGAYCMSFDDAEYLNPEREAREFLARMDSVEKCSHGAMVSRVHAVYLQSHCSAGC